MASRRAGNLHPPNLADGGSRDLSTASGATLAPALSSLWTEVSSLNGKFNSWILLKMPQMAGQHPTFKKTQATQSKSRDRMKSLRPENYDLVWQLFWVDNVGDLVAQKDLQFRPPKQ